MSYVSHISVVTLAAALGSACTERRDETLVKSEENILLVSSESYRDGICWTHKDGSFRAFLALARDGTYAVPDFISVNCLISGDSSYGGEIISHIGTILMLDKYGQLQGKFPNLQIGGNVASDQPFPKGDDKVYYFKADINKVPHPYQSVYAPSKIKMLVDLHMSFDELLRFSREEREKLLQSIE